MKGAERVCVCFEGKQVDAAGEESSTMLSVTGGRFLRGASRYVQYDDTAGQYYCNGTADPYG